MIIVKTRDGSAYFGAIDSIGDRVRHHVVYRRHGPFRNLAEALMALPNVGDRGEHGAADDVIFCLTGSMGTISIRRCCVASRIPAEGVYEQVTEWFDSIGDAEAELEYVRSARVLVDAMPMPAGGGYPGSEI